MPSVKRTAMNEKEEELGTKVPKKTKFPTVFEDIWRNKWLTAKAESYDDMISSLQKAIEELEEMKKDGIVADFSSSDDDYIFMRTTNVELAKKYRMVSFTESDDDDEDDDGDHYEGGQASDSDASSESNE